MGIGPHFGSSLSFFWRLALIFLSACSTSSRIRETPFGFEAFYIIGSEDSRFTDPQTLLSVFPANRFGDRKSGYSFGAMIPATRQKTLSYEVKFEPTFDFRRGGKLPGLCGGQDASGGIRANGRNGFSARLMWREDGRLVSYVYHVGQKNEYGDDFDWKMPDHEPVFFTRGVWHQIKIYLSLNDLGVSNGTMIAYFDGRLAFQKRDFIFRKIDSIEVNRLCFNTFFGGNDVSWAPQKEEKLFVRNLKIE